METEEGTLAASSLGQDVWQHILDYLQWDKQDAVHFAYKRIKENQCLVQCLIRYSPVFYDWVIFRTGHTWYFDNFQIGTHWSFVKAEETSVRFVKANNPTGCPKALYYEFALGKKNCDRTIDLLPLVLSAVDDTLKILSLSNVEELASLIVDVICDEMYYKRDKFRREHASLYNKWDFSI